MNEMLPYFLALLAGLVLGGLFFGGLWWTVQKGLSANQPALWFCLSFLLRSGAVLAGIYFVAGADWQQLLACLAGFIIARLIVIWLTGKVGIDKTPIRETSHAP